MKSPSLLLVVPPVMKCTVAGRDLVEGRKGLGRERGDRQVRAVGDEDLQALDVGCDEGGGLRRIR